MNKRREEILSEIPNCGVVCDVGCDHGYLGWECLVRNVAEKVIFSDISEQSLQKAKDLLGKSEGDMLERASFVHCNGLEEIDVETVDIAVICGMGGEEILKILAVKKPRCCVLQPMSEVEKLREIISVEYKIVVDRLFLDRGKYYNLLKIEKLPSDCNQAEREQMKYSDMEMMFGKSNLQAPSADFLEYAKARLERQKAIKKNRKDVSKKDDIIIDFLCGFIKEHGEAEK